MSLEEVVGQNDMWDRHKFESLVLLAALGLLGCVTRSPQETPNIVTTSSLSEERAASLENLAKKSGQEVIAQPSIEEIWMAAKQIVFDNSQDVRIASIEDIKVASDLTGRWWVSATVVPEESARTDNAIIFMVKKGKTWELVDLGTGVVPEELPLPTEVRGSLRK